MTNYLLNLKHIYIKKTKTAAKTVKMNRACCHDVKLGIMFGTNTRTS